MIFWTFMFGTQTLELKKKKEELDIFHASNDMRCTSQQEHKFIDQMVVVNETKRVLSSLETC